MTSTTSIFSSQDVGALHAHRRSFSPAFATAARPAIIVVASATATVGYLGPEQGAWIWVASLLLFGMPHGAYDLAALRRSSDRPWRAFACYTLIMLVCAGAFALSPAASIASFLLLTAHHFGISDSVVTRGRFPRAIGDHLAGLARGLVVIASPFVFYPDAAWEPFQSVANLLPAPAAVDTSTVITFAALAMGLGLVASIGVIAVLIRQRRWLCVSEECGVIGGMVLLSALADPLAAVAVYFVVVHASGHCMRAHVPGKPTREPAFSNAVRTHRESLALLLPSVVITIGGAVWLFGGLSSSTMALSFILFCVIATLPHHLVWLGMFAGRQQH